MVGDSDLAEVGVAFRPSHLGVLALCGEDAALCNVYPLALHVGELLRGDCRFNALVEHGDGLLQAGNTVIPVRED